MRTIFSKFALTAALMLAITFTFSCSAVDDAINGSSSSGGGSEQSYDYCITAAGCLSGPFTASTCTGQLSNGCPNGSSPSVGSSSSVKSSSSSSSSGGSVTPTYSLDGVWSTESGSTQVTVSGSTSNGTGVFSVYSPTNLDPLTQSALDKGYTGVGKQYWRNIKSTGTLTWSGQISKVQYYTSNPNVAIGISWVDCTFTMSADGQSITVESSDKSGSGTQTWKRM